jgi:putative transposase
MADKDPKPEAPPGIPVARKQVDFRVGNLVTQGNSTFRIVRVVDFETLVADDVETGRSAVLRVMEVEPLDDKNVAPAQDVDAILDEDWRIANQRYRAIEPLLVLNCTQI